MKMGDQLRTPNCASFGVVLPIGAYKGSNFDVDGNFVWVFSGANFGGDVPDQYTVMDRSQNVGHFFMAMKPGIFVTEQGFRDRMVFTLIRWKTTTRKWI